MSCFHISASRIGATPKVSASLVCDIIDAQHAVYFEGSYIVFEGGVTANNTTLVLDMGEFVYHTLRLVN